jgi:DNA-binding MarR family transcriptional regulator
MPVPEAISDNSAHPRKTRKSDALKSEVIKRFGELAHHIENNHHPEEYLLAKAMQRVEKLKELRLSLTEFHIISCIGDNGQANQTLVSKSVNLSNAGVYKNTLKLSDKKVIKLEKLPNNKKEVHYRLTPLGEELYRIHSEMHRITEQNFMERLSGFTIRELASINRFLSEFDMFADLKEEG